MYKNDTYYIQPKPGDKKVFAYVDANLSNTIKINGKTLMFKIKDLFGVENWQKEWTASVGKRSE
jgi:gentisate 1,2-dioxygenase